METTSELPEEDQAPVKALKIRGRSRPSRLRPGQQDRLREAKLDLGARYRIETDENLILQQFFDETFDTWLTKKLTPTTTTTEEKKRRGSR